MADKKERLIDQDPNIGDEDGGPAGVPFYKTPMFALVIKISLAIGILSTVITALLITNSRLGNLEVIFKETLSQVTQITAQQKIIIGNIKTLTSEHKALAANVEQFDLGSAKGDLNQALKILDTQSKAIDKQLAVTRNGLISLSRMIQGSRVWQDDYSGQYQSLFDHNKEIKQMIKDLRGIQDVKREEPQYIEMDF
ncbi:MAG: cell division protein FtsI/penicillin-binding protein 2 [Oceanicoccus sp.]|jgi:cell division protein FtsI/penicillin-binding protein 2